jgi:hypothetical protein
VVRGTTSCSACKEAAWNARLEEENDKIEAQWLAQETKPDGSEAELWSQCDGDDFRTLEAHMEELEEELLDSRDTEVCQYYHPTEPIDSEVVGKQMYRAHRVIEALYEYSYDGWESEHTEAEYEEALKPLHDLVSTENLGCVIDASRVLLVIARMGADGEPISEVITDEAQIREVVS